MPRITHTQMLAETKALAETVRRGAERHQQLAAQLDAEAMDASRIAEQIGALDVDPATVAETNQLSQILRGLSEAAIAFANAADEVSRAARATEQQTLTDHGGIHEAVRRAPVRMPHRDWLTQE